MGEKNYMDQIGIKFGNLAVYNVIAIKYENETASEETWKKYARKVLVTDCYVNKPCPKNTFLGLCSLGLIKGIPAGDYLSSNSVETEYAKIAIEILMKYKSFADKPRDLWKKVLKIGGYDVDKHYDFQMNVVCALWNADMINLDALDTSRFNDADFLDSSDFNFEGKSYTILQVDNTRYEIIDKVTGQKDLNMKGVAQSYLKKKE